MSSKSQSLKTPAPESADIAYRPDIDGLRAVAVLSVVLFHINTVLVPGGFIGVDIFFVISGFLITSNIRNQARQGIFTFSNFYARRIKRIVPAMATVVAVTVLVGQFVMTPEHLDELARSAIASVFSLANVFFTYFVDTGYFADDSATKPLLHLWSLGVEEQYYLIWPLLAVGLLWLRFSDRVRLAILLAAAVALVALSEWLVRTNPVFAYYMLPSRAFELLFGAVLAFCPRLSNRAASEVLALVGLALLAYSLVFITETAPFPGLYAVPGTLGTTLLIYSGSAHRTWIGRVLSYSPIRWIGLISYSFYLWHWPILAFLRYTYVPITPVVGAASFVLMIALSALSYYFVEKPFRKRRSTPARTTVNQLLVPGGVISACCLAVILTGGYGLYDTDSYRDRLNQVWHAVKPANRFSYVCQESTITAKVLANPKCVLNAKAGSPHVLLWGDSNAAQYIGVIGAIAKAEGFSFRNAAAQSCPPVFDVPGLYERPVDRCSDSNKTVEHVFAKYPTIIIGGHWSLYARNPNFYDALEKTITRLEDQGTRVILLGQIPPIEEFDRYCPRKAVKVPFLECAKLFLSPRPGNEGDSANEDLRKIVARHPNSSLFDINDLICRKGVCSPYFAGEPIYYNSTHLSMAGSWLLGKTLVRNGISDIFKSLERDHSPSHEARN